MVKEETMRDVAIIGAENACASSSTAFHLAWLYVASGMYDMALAVGVEKLYHEDKRKSFAAIGAAVDVEWMQGMQAAMKASRSGDGGGQPAIGEGAGGR